jgi:peptide chain release factor 1
MYTSLASRLRMPSTLQDYTPDESVSSSSSAITSAILEISSPNAYALLRSEAGVHRVQRVPATEKKGRTHTSAVSVLVLPSLPATDADNALNYADPDSDYYIAPAEVRSETMRARGAGGQHVNKTDSAIRLTHIPTGIVISMQESRSQHSNREKAWTLLRSKLAARRRDAREEEMINLRRKVMGGVARTGREDKVRTYNWSQNRVTDHRSGWEGSDLDDMLGGGEALEECMASVRGWMDEREVEGLLAEEEAKAREGEKQANGST